MLNGTRSVTIALALLGLGVSVGIGCGINAVGTMADAAGADASTDATGNPAAADGAVDARSDAPDSCATWHARLFDPCTIPAPGAAIVAPAGATITYDTSIPGFVEDPSADPPATKIDQGGTAAVVISVDGFTLPASTTLRVIGDKPLIVASWTTIDIEGTLDVGSSLANGRSGAGANPSLCSATKAEPGTDESDTGGGSGGGGGGAFQGAGGKGGPGDTGGQNPGGAGGQRVAAPTLVRGGCSGAMSGKAGPDSSVTSPSNANTTAAGGTGGGAVLLSAMQSITVGAAGRVLAGGSGGAGAELHSAVGGGGGGSGGYIGFDAPTYAFVASARIAANGGGGGASNAFSSTGAAGADGRDDTTAASGGSAGTCAAAGPPGGAGATLDGSSASQSAFACGGAGGGGGVGYIQVFAPSFTPSGQVSFSPLPTVTN